MRLLIRLSLLVASLLASAAPADPPSLESGTVLAAAERLRPGEYLWAPQVAPQGPVLLVVSLATQRAVIYRNGIPIGITTVSTGRPGYRTPTGVFTILQRRVEHYSNLYNNAPMPYMQRLTWGGVALHGGALPGYPASHGCIRLPMEFARLLYGVTRLGMTVVVTDQPALPSVAPTPDLLLGRSASSARAATSETLWNPEAAPTGPVSILISGADRRVIVLRNGRIIGSAPIEIEERIDSTAAYVLNDIDEQGHRWLRIPLPGQTSTAAYSAGQRDRFRVAEEFRQAVRAILQPGTTVVIAPDSLGPRSPLKDATLIEAVPDEPQVR